VRPGEPIDLDDVGRSAVLVIRVIRLRSRADVRLRGSVFLSIHCHSAEHRRKPAAAPISANPPIQFSYSFANDAQCGTGGSIRIRRIRRRSEYSLLQESGNGRQDVYLTEVPQALAEALIGLIGQAYWDGYSEITALQSPAELALPDTATVEDRITGPTFREQIVRARRGQGVFRANVLLREESCRVTRVAEPRHLKASHIKPWRDATDAERLDGANGLLLSPHIDHLFDEGYITFSNNNTSFVYLVSESSIFNLTTIYQSSNLPILQGANIMLSDMSHTAAAQ
jgi:hypothetical protein